jgi:pyruvate/2-oxoglutarate dehydrogenase complex dihydrolipoamide dehydrogenase (E3) component
MQVHRHGLEHNDRARADSTTDGEIAVVAVGGRIVGGHAIEPHAGELIHELVLAIRAGMKISDLTDMVHIYPTLSSGIGRLAADSAYRTASKLKVFAKVGRLLG